MRDALPALLLLVPCLALAEVPEGWFPFVVGELASDSVCNVSSYNNVVAGESGFVQLRDGHFYDGSGKRLRFLATNLTFSNAFPDKALAPLIAKRMASLGINCVRFHHMDNQYRPSGIWDPAFKDHQHLDAEQLDRLDWLIYQLKLNGIYANINLHVSRQFSAADGFENTEKLTQSYDKGVDNFCARMIELQRNYARDLLTHENPYTKTRYVDEPCIAMVELNNENSLLGFAYGRYLHDLPEPYKGELVGYWIDFLKGKYQTTDALRQAWDEGSAPLGQELLRNQDFSQGTKEWVLESKNPRTDVFEVTDDPQLGKVLHARLNTLGANSWDFQIHQVGHDFEANKTYTVSFKIKADPPREVHVGTRYDVADWRSVGLDERVKADQQWRSFEFTFRAREPKPQHNRLSFNCQNQLGDVWLAQVSLRPGGIRGLPADQTLEAGTVAFPTSASTRQAQRDWFEFIMGLESRYTQGLYRYLKDDLGLHAPVVDTQATYGGVGGLWRESQLDYIDVHAYWQHPSFPGRPWDPANWLIGNSAMVDRLGADCLTGLALYRAAGKAFTVSEYNHPAPNDYRAECMPMLAAFAALQDWDGIFEFDYGSTPASWEEARIQGFFQMVTDPAKCAFFPIAANLFRRGDVRPAEGEVRLRIPKAQVVDVVTDSRGDLGATWRKAAVPREASVMKRLAVEWTDGAEVVADAVTLPDTKAVVADTNEMSWNCTDPQRSMFTVSTPKTRVVVGRPGDAEVRWPDMRLTAASLEGFVVAALTSMDNLPLSESKRMLLVVMGKCENQDMGWDTARKTVGRNWGKGPSIAESVSVKLSLEDRKLKAWPLDGSGRRMGEATEGQTLELRGQTCWYELTAD